MPNPYCWVLCDTDICNGHEDIFVPETTTITATTSEMTTRKNDFCERDENLVVVIHCAEECVSEMRDCLIECDTDDKERFKE